MGKGKGRQCGSFTTKSMKAQFQTEIQTRIDEDAAERRRRRPKVASSRVQERPKLQIRSLQEMLQELQHNDQLVHRAIRQKSSAEARRHVTAPGWLVYHHDDDYGKDYQSGLTLQSLCLKILAPSLPEYLDVLGEEKLHYYLSLLPGPALTALSVHVSNTIGMSNPLVGLLNQTHVTRLSIVAPTNDDESDSNWKALSKDGLNALVPQWGHVAYAVRENWEDSSDEEDGRWQWRGCRRLERLELGNIPHLSAESLEELFDACSALTHLGLSGSCSYESGPEVLLRLPEWLPQLQFLDISGNHWVTENLLRKIYHEFNHRHPQVLQIKALGCMQHTSQYSLEIEYPDQFLID